MPLMSSELYDALLDAGASDEKARKAAEAVAGYDQRLGAIERKLDVLTWMVTFNLLLTVGVLWRVLVLK
jgi:hypothetical protein